MTFEFDWRKLSHQATEYVKQDKELRIYGIVILVVALVGGSYFGYRWMSERWTQKSQLAFSESYELYQQAISTQFNEKAKNEDKKELWEQTEIDFKQAYEHNKRSSLAPFFEAFRSQALNYQGDREESLKMMRQAIKNMSSGNPYRGLYDVELAFMLLDGTAEEVAEGLKQLTAVADNDKSNFQDMARYYLGVYFTIAGEPDNAVGYWKKIKEEPLATKFSKGKSPWYQLAKMKLVELGHEK